MKISTRGRYALRFMIDLAEHNNDKYVPLKDISARQNISIKYLEQIIALLNKFGMLKSIRGPQGGYKLSRGVSEYTVGEILRLTEGSLAPVTCLEESPVECERAAHCPTLKIWQGLDKVINTYLDNITLDQLIADANAFDYTI